MNLPVNQLEAKAARSTTYFTGKPCLYGHVSFRFTANGRCSECKKKYELLKGPERCKAYRSVEENKVKTKIWRLKHRKKSGVLEYRRDYQRDRRRTIDRTYAIKLLGIGKDAPDILLQTKRLCVLIKRKLKDIHNDNHN